MAHKFSELEGKMSPESRACVGKAVQEALKDIPLDELRNARGIPQSASISAASAELA